MKRRHLIEAILFLSYAAFGVSWLAVAPLAVDLLRVFGVTPAQFADLNTAVALPKIVVPVVAGWAANRFGLKRTILVALVLVCAVAAGPLVPRFDVVLASRFVFGVGGAVLVTLMAPMVMQWFPKPELPTVNALNGVAVNTGIAFTMFLTAPLAATAAGWRGTLLAYAAVHVVLLVAWAVVGRDPGGGGDDDAITRPMTGREPRVRYVDVWRMKETWLVSLAFTGGVALYLTFSFWLPAFYQEHLGLARGAASRITGLVNLAGIPSAIVCGLLTRHLGVRRPFLVAGGLVTGIAAFGMFLCTSPAAAAASAIVLGVALFTPTAAIVTSIMELRGVTPRHVSLIMGTMFTFCYALSGLAPKLVGFLHGVTGSYVPGFTVMAVFSWVILVAGLLLPETGPGRSLPSCTPPGRSTGATPRFQPRASPSSSRAP
jgi:cyanate permease